MYLGNFKLGSYMTIAVQANDTSGNASPIGVNEYFQLKIYKSDPAQGNAPVELTNVTTTFANQLGPDGLYYIKVQLTEAAGFEEDKQYFARVGEAVIDTKRPATLYYFRVGSGYDANLVSIAGESISEGHTATLKLKSVEVKNSTGYAVQVQDNYTGI